MLEKIKKYLYTLAFILLAVMVLPQTLSYADEVELSAEKILLMNKSELLAELENGELTLPTYYDTHRAVAETFVYKYTPLLLKEELDTSVPQFNYMPSNEMLKNLEISLIKRGLLKEKDFSKIYPETSYLSRYSLKDSTILGTWNSNYENYNCYAYSIGLTSWRQPDGGAGYSYYDVSKSISSIADDVLADLDSLGYWGYKTTTKPKSLPDKHFRVICVRKDTDNIDYHFMKKSGSSLNNWIHKPGGTQPLKWNYSSPSKKVWTNEYVYKGVAHAPTVTYESTIYYILYKGKNDPGIQRNDISMTEIEELISE